MRKGFCKKGHKLNETNSYLRKDGSRLCKICTVERNAQSYADPVKKKEQLKMQNDYYYKNKEEINLKNRTRWHQNKEKYKITSKAWHDKTLLELKVETLTHYGNGKLACQCCGVDIIEFLTLDHINGRQEHERGSHEKRAKYSGRSLWRYLQKQGYPEGYQTLCINCNMGKHINKGICPHKEA